MSERPHGDPESDSTAGERLHSEPQVSAVTSVDREDDGVTAAPRDALSVSTLRPDTASWDEAPPLDPPSGAVGSRMGRYTVLSELGAGGMGVVYKAWDPALDRAVALKVLLAGRLAPQRHLARFLDEARAIARLDHPALVEVYDIGLVDGCPYFTMEFVDGSDLNRLIADTPLDPLRACRLLEPVARGLEAAHRQGIIHRDVKPANVLVDADDTPRLIDFGVARFLESTDERTRTGQVVGTPAYMAPEQAVGDLSAIGPATDVFGLGASLYRAVSGALPRRSTESGDSGLPRRPADTGDGALPRDLAAICHKAMSHDPGDRYGSAAALADDMARFARGEPVEAALPGIWRRFGWRVRAARSGLIGAAVTVLVGVVVALAADAWRVHGEREARAAREAAAETRLTEALVDGRRLRAAGDVSAAAAVEREVTLRREVQETRALARFHLSRAEDALERQDRSAALGAAASAYATATHEAESFDAMLTLGRLFVELRRGTALETLLETIERRFPTRRVELGALAVQGATLVGRLAVAAQRARALGSDRGPMLAALSRAAPTDWTYEALGGRVWTWDQGLADVDGDGALDLNVGAHLLSAGSPALRPTRVPLLPDGQFPFPLGPGLVAGLQGDAPHRLLRLEGGAWRTLAPLERSRLLALGDLDGDGRETLYGARGWGLSAFDEQPDGSWRRSVPHPPTDATRIEPRAMFVADFGDRGPALVIGSAEWRTYDVRIYTAAPGGGLLLAARRKLGAVFDVRPVPRPGRPPLIAAALRAQPPEPRMFPPEAPSGHPPGLVLLEWTDAGLEIRGHLPTATDEDGDISVRVGDFDGDGRSDLAASPTHVFSRDLLVYRGLADGWSAPVALPGLDAVAAADLDGDGDDELVVRAAQRSRLWVLGVAGAPAVDLPVWRIPAADDVPLAEGGGPRAAAIRDLVRLGLVDEAIEAWQHQVRLGLAPAASAANAARLSEQRERYGEAAGLFLRAATLYGGEPGAVDALRGAARTQRAARLWAEERATLDRLLAHRLAPAARTEALARRATLDARLARRVTFDLGGDLDPRWRVPVPDRLRVDRDGALEITADMAGPMARLPVERTGGPVAIEIDMRVPRVEYGSSFGVQLVAVEGDTRRALTNVLSLGWGGGSVVYHRAQLVRPDGQQVVFFNRRVATPRGHRIFARVELDPERGLATNVERTGEDYTTHPAPPLAPDARLYLEIVSSSGDRRMGHHMRVRIERLVLDGLRVVDGHPGDAAGDHPLHGAGRALAHAAPADALAALSGVEGERADAIRAAALYDLGRWGEADALVLARLARLTPGSPFERFVRGRVLRDPLHFAPLVRRGLGPAADELLWRVFMAAFDKHGRDPDVVVAARAALLGVEDQTPEEVARSPHADRRLALWQARAAMHRDAGQAGAARADLARCMALLEHLPAPSGTAETQRRGEQWATLYRMQADVHADAGRADAAAEAIRAGLAAAPAPELVADQLIASRPLRALRDHPVWAEVQRAAAWSTPAPTEVRAPGR